jgi:Domain of unknown function (DUF4281)
MSPDLVFSIANAGALACWLALVVLPRWPWLTRTLGFGWIGFLSLAYSVIVALRFFGVDGGGFNSIGQVRALFADDWTLTAGWIHYLAFDLFVGLWIARKLDGHGVHRLIQAPVLLLTFMFGPAGLMTYYAMAGAKRFEAAGKGA